MKFKQIIKLLESLDGKISFNELDELNKTIESIYVKDYSQQHRRSV